MMCCIDYCGASTMTACKNYYWQRTSSLSTKRSPQHKLWNSQSHCPWLTADVALPTVTSFNQSTLHTVGCISAVASDSTCHTAVLPSTVEVNTNRMIAHSRMLPAMFVAKRGTSLIYVAASIAQHSNRLTARGANHHRRRSTIITSSCTQRNQMMYLLFELRGVPSDPLSVTV